MKQITTFWEVLSIEILPVALKKASELHPANWTFQQLNLKVRQIILIKNKFIVWDETSKLVHLIISQPHFYEDAIWFLSSPQRGIYLCNALTTDFQSTQTQTAPGEDSFHMCKDENDPTGKFAAWPFLAGTVMGRTPVPVLVAWQKMINALLRNKVVFVKIISHCWHSEQNSLPAISLKTTDWNVINI